MHLTDYVLSLLTSQLMSSRFQVLENNSVSDEESNSKIAERELVLIRIHSDNNDKR